MGCVTSGVLDVYHSGVREYRVCCVPCVGMCVGGCVGWRETEYEITGGIGFEGVKMIMI
jgi:hypothetical protein